MGEAPVESQGFAVSKVCPQCYEEILMDYKNGTLFPSFMLKKDARTGETRIEVLKEDGAKTKMVRPEDMFVPPANKGLKKERGLQERLNGDKGVFTRATLKKKKGTIECFALLPKDAKNLEFYQAAFDKKPIESHFLFGYTLRETAVEKGTQFVLFHQNQIGRREMRDGLVFTVPQSSAAAMSLALAEAIQS